MSITEDSEEDTTEDPEEAVTTEDPEEGSETEEPHTEEYQKMRIQ